MDVKVTKDKYISRWIDQENVVYVDEIEAKTMHKGKEGDWYRKKNQDTECSKASEKLK